MKRFSYQAVERCSYQGLERDFSKLEGQHFDVLVMGAGIYGAWTAYDAALRGLRVALIDQGDFASGTSSASSKLIHGGLRYLESYDFKLVRKTLAERQMLLKTAPHRVWPLRFGVPVYKHSRLGALQLTLGLMLYDWLAGNVPKTQRYRRYASGAFSARFPALSTHDLKSGFTYLDAQTDDARFVLELIAGAAALGAVCVNYCQAAALLEEQGVLNGAVVTDMASGATSTVYARKLVDCMGRWSIAQGHHNGRLSKGVHLILPKVLSDEALLLTAQSDGRVFFIIPWYGLTLVGTTDTNYHGDIDKLTVEPEELEYLLREANHVLKTHWTKADVIGRYAGVRVLKPSGHESPSAMSRDWELVQAINGLISSVGGKFTSAREDAEVIVDSVCAELNCKQPCMTFGRPFPWLPVLEPGSSYTDWAEAKLKEALKLGVDAECADWLLRRHGANTDAVLALCAKDADLCRRITPTLHFIRADLQFCARHESVVHLEDLLRRRVPVLILAKLSATEIYIIAQEVAGVLGWGEERLMQEVQDCVKKTCVTV